MSKFLELYDFLKNSRLRQIYTETYDDCFIYLVFLFKYMNLIHETYTLPTSTEIENLKKYLMENMENIRRCIHENKIHASLNNLLGKIESNTETTILEHTNDNYLKYYKPLFMMLLHHNKLSHAEHVFMKFLPKMVLIRIRTHGSICVSKYEKSCQKVMNDTDSKIILIQSASIGNVDYVHLKEIQDFIKTNFKKNKHLSPIKNILEITKKLHEIDRELYGKRTRRYLENKTENYEKNYEKKYNVQIINRGEYYLNKKFEQWLDAHEITVVNENSTNDFDVYSLMSKQIPKDGSVKLSDIIKFFNSKRVKYIVIFDFTCSDCDIDTSTAESKLVSKKKINYKPEIQKLLESETPEVLKMSYNTPERDKKDKIETKIETAEAESSKLKDELDELTRKFESEKKSYPTIEYYNLKKIEGESKNRDFLLKKYELERLKIEKKIFEINLDKRKKYENYESLKIQKEEEIQKQIEESEKQIEELDKRIEESEKQIKKFNEESEKQENELFQQLDSLEIEMKDKLSRFDEILQKINKENEIISRSSKQINEVRIKKISDILIRFKSYVEDLKKNDKPIKIKDIRLFNHDDLTHIKYGVNLLKKYGDIIIIYSRFIVDFITLYDRCIHNIFRFISGVKSVTTEESFEKEIEPDIIDEIYYDIYVLEYLFSGKLFNREKLRIKEEKKDYKYIKDFFEKIEETIPTRTRTKREIPKDKNISDFYPVMPVNSGVGVNPMISSAHGNSGVNPIIPSATSQNRIQKIYHGMRKRIGSIGSRIFSSKKRTTSRGGRHTRKCRSHRNKKLV